MSEQPFGGQRPKPSFASPINTPQQGHIAPSKETRVAEEIIQDSTSIEVEPSKFTPRTVPANFLPDLSPFTLTVGQARDLYAQQNRKVPAKRTVQEKCASGHIHAYKIGTTRNGRPVQEWLINEASLLKYIKSLPVVPASQKMARVVKGQAGNTSSVEIRPRAFASQKTVYDAEEETTVKNKPDVPATPQKNRDASFEDRDLVSALIENARTLAQLEGKELQIQEIRTGHVAEVRQMEKQITYLETSLTTALDAISNNTDVVTIAQDLLKMVESAAWAKANGTVSATTIEPVDGV